MHEIPDELRGGPFTKARAAELGLDRAVLRGRRFRRVLPGIYAPSGLPDSLLLRSRAALLLRPDAVVSHETATALAGLPLPPGAPVPAVHLSVDREPRPRCAGVVGHLTTFSSGDVAEIGGLRLTSGARTWCDLAASGWELVDLVAYADAVQRRNPRTGLKALRARVACWTGRRGAHALGQALDLTRARVDSPPETRLRLLLVHGGLPEPEVAVPIRDEDGTPLHTADLGWTALRYALDYDGEHHFVDGRTEAGRHRRQLDIARVESARDIGWTLSIVTALDLRQPARLLHRVATELRDRGARW